LLSTRESSNDLQAKPLHVVELTLSAQGGESASMVAQ
jgi:hypothetical protein